MTTGCRKPNVFGKGADQRLLGPAIKPIGLHFIADMAKCEELGLPLSGIGGIETWVDALEYLLVGATTIQVTTGIIHYGYRIVEDMIEGLSDYMARKGIARVADLIGKALPNLQETDHFDLERQGVAAVRPRPLHRLRPVLHRLQGRRRPGSGLGRENAAARTRSRTSA